MITSNPDPVRPLSAISVETVELDGGVLVFVEGDVDSETAPELALTLGRYAEHRLLVDMSRVDFFDAAAVSVLLAAAHRVRGLGGSLRIVAVTPFGRRLFELLELSDTFGLDLLPVGEPGGSVDLVAGRGDLGSDTGDNDDRSGGSCPTP